MFSSKPGSHAFWRVKRLRELKGVTLEALAERAGLTKSYVSKVERGISTPSIATAIKIADALGVGVNDLFGAGQSQQDFTIIRKTDRKPFARMGKAGHRYEAITPGEVHGLFETFIDFPPFAEPRGYQRAQHRGREMVFVVKGGIDIAFPHASAQLKAGDCIVFDGQIPHRILSLRPTQAEILVIITAEKP
jgi:transcriptional regulator with XRE-family HTH domain